MANQSYIGAAPLNRVDTQNRVTHIAAAGQTSFAANYTPGYVDVYYNQNKLVGPTGVDFTAIDGLNIVLPVPAQLGDSVEIVAIKASSPYDFYTKAQSDVRMDNFYAIAVGTSDSLSITANPLPASLVDGMEIKVRVASANTTTTPTVTISNLGLARTITCLGGQALQVGSWVANQEITLRYNVTGSRFECLEGDTARIRSDLAAPSGSAGVGTIGAGTGAIPRTLQDKARENISASDYSTIQQAITAAGASGSVTIPASYAGTDAYTTDDNIPITDLRHKQTGFWSRIGPSYPITRYPFGNDAVLLARGPADLYIEHFHVEATTTVTLNVGLNTNVPISAVTCGNKRFPADSGTGGTEMFSEFAQLFIGRETANEEQVNQGSWSIVDATHINITCTKTHTGITDIDQGGSTLLNSQDLFIGSNAVKPSQNTTYSAPLRVKDLGGRIIAKVPSNIDDIFPHSMWQWGAVQSGLYGVNRDLRYKQSLSTSKVIWGNFDNVEIASLNNAGAYKALGGLAAGEGQMTLDGDKAEIKIGRNVDGRAITSPVDCHVVFQNNLDSLNPSSTAGSLLLATAIVGSSINFAPQNVWSGSISANGMKLKTGFGCNNKEPQAAKASGGTLAGVIAALVANGILSS